MRKFHFLWKLLTDRDSITQGNRCLHGDKDSEGIQHVRERNPARIENALRSLRNTASCTPHLELLTAIEPRLQPTKANKGGHDQRFYTKVLYRYWLHDHGYVAAGRR